MPSVTLTSISQDGNGRIRIRFGKVEREYNSIEHLRTSVRAALTREDLIDMALALIVSRQPNLSNPAILEGRTVTVDFSLPAWGTVV